MGPGPGGAKPHFHRTMSESFFVLDGTLQIFDGRAWTDARPGDFAHVPDGGVHGFRNESGAPREAYFEGLVELAEGRWEPTHDELQAFLVAHDNHYL